MTLPSCQYLLNSSPSRGLAPGKRSLIAYRLTTGETLSNPTIMPNEIVLPRMQVGADFLCIYSNRRGLLILRSFCLRFPALQLGNENGDRRIVEIGKRLIFLKMPRFGCRIYSPG